MPLTDPKMDDSIVPRNDTVMTSLKRGQRVGMTARLALTDPIADESAPNSEHVRTEDEAALRKEAVA